MYSKPLRDFYALPYQFIQSLEKFIIWTGIRSKLRNPGFQDFPHVVLQTNKRTLETSLRNLSPVDHGGVSIYNMCIYIHTHTQSCE